MCDCGHCVTLTDTDTQHWLTLLCVPYEPVQSGPPTTYTLPVVALPTVVIIPRMLVLRGNGDAPVRYHFLSLGPLNRPTSAHAGLIIGTLCSAQRSRQPEKAATQARNSTAGRSFCATKVSSWWWQQ
jgi:hypothetical protein